MVPGRVVLVICRSRSQPQCTSTLILGEVEVEVPTGILILPGSKRCIILYHYIFIILFSCPQIGNEFQLLEA